MAQTRVFTVSKGTTVRRHRTSGATSGQGQAKRWYVGRRGDYDYDSYVRFDYDWTNVGKIVKAVLTIYTDDGLGDMPSTNDEHPHVYVRRLTDGFDQGNAPDGDWQANDYTSAGATTTRQRSVDLTRAELGVNNIDVTYMVEGHAPSTVKRRDGSPGGKASNHGFGLFGTTDTDENIGLVSHKWSDTALRPVITLTYELGPTTPDAPSSMQPQGSVPALTDFQADFTDVRPTDTLAYSEVEVYDGGHSGTAAVNNFITDAAHGLQNGDIIYMTSLTGGAGLTTYLKYYVRARTTNTFKVAIHNSDSDIVNITDDYSALTWSKRLYSGRKKATRGEIDADHFTHVPDSLATLRPNTNYRWRARVTDQENKTSAWSGLVTFSFENTAPNTPTLSPQSGSYATLDGIQFTASFSDPDVGDSMIAYQFQLSAYPEGDARWDDDEFILWNTGKRYVTPGDPAISPYGGDGLDAGTYYWRGRVFDSKHAASDWEYATLTVMETFEPDPEEATTAIQFRPRAPWRIVIKGLGALRGPGSIVAVIEDAKNVGASELYNSPGELHFTLPKDHPQIAAIEPRRTHYSLQFRQGDGWYEKFAGLMTDFDASDTDVVFYGLDYLALLDSIVDERYDPSNPEKAAEKGGSKYVTTGKNSIKYIVKDQLTKAKALANSPVGFITISDANIATMNETLTVYSTYAPVLQFIVGLLDSHRAGTGKRTRLRVRRSNSGGYEWVVTDDPGQVRDNLRMRYGELVQGYRIVAFGADWATRIHGIGRGKDGIKVLYDKQTGQGIPEATWGRFTRVQLFDGVSDANDFKRRIRQAAMAAGKLGKQVGLGLRSGILGPKDGYDICDVFPLSIEDGPVSTEALGSGYFAVVGVTWECSAQDGKQNTTLSFQPRQDGSVPDADLLVQGEVNTQAEWQIGWTDPNPLTASSRFWLDQSTGRVFERTDGTLVGEGITGTA